MFAPMAWWYGKRGRFEYYAIELPKKVLVFVSCVYMYSAITFTWNNSIAARVLHGRTQADTHKMCALHHVKHTKRI